MRDQLRSRRSRSEARYERTNPSADIDIDIDDHVDDHDHHNRHDNDAHDDDVVRADCEDRNHATCNDRRRGVTCSVLDDASTGIELHGGPAVNKSGDLDSSGHDASDRADRQHHIDHDDRSRNHDDDRHYCKHHNDDAPADVDNRGHVRARRDDHHGETVSPCVARNGSSEWAVCI